MLRSELTSLVDDVRLMARLMARAAHGRALFQVHLVRYRQAWARSHARFGELTAAGFPVGDPNRHPTLESFLESRRARSHPYDALLPVLEDLAREPESASARMLPAHRQDVVLPSSLLSEATPDPGGPPAGAVAVLGPTQLLDALGGAHATDPGEPFLVHFDDGVVTLRHSGFDQGRLHLRAEDFLRFEIAMWRSFLPAVYRPTNRFSFVTHVEPGAAMPGQGRCI
jgi:hypothetical protein